MPDRDGRKPAGCFLQALLAQFTEQAETADMRAAADLLATLAPGLPLWRCAMMDGSARSRNAFSVQVGRGHGAAPRPRVLRAGKRDEMHTQAIPFGLECD